VGTVTPTRSTRTGARPAPSAEAALRFAPTLARACAGALGETVAGAILHGSLTLDDDVPGRSDVDLLMVIDDPFSDARLAALTEAMAWRRAEAPGPVDLRPVRQVAACPTPAPPLEAYLRLTPRSGVRLEERRHPGERDLAVELSVCRTHGRSLLGAAPAELLGEAARIDPAQVQQLLGMVRARLAGARDAPKTIVLQSEPLYVHGYQVARELPLHPSSPRPAGGRLRRPRRPDRVPGTKKPTAPLRARTG